MNTIEQPITRREGVKMLNEMSLIEYALEAAICEDQGGPMTSSPTQRRNVSNTLRGLAARFETLADVVDPLMDDALPYELAVDRGEPSVAHIVGGFAVGDRVKLPSWDEVFRITKLDADGLARLEPEEDSSFAIHGNITRVNATKLKSLSLTNKPADGEDTTSTPPAGA